MKLIDRMKMSARVHQTFRITVALTIALLIVASPLCAPLCAATACAAANSASDSSSESCHHATASSAAGSSAMAAPQLCNLQELPTAALRGARSAMQQHAKRVALPSPVAAGNESLAGPLNSWPQLFDFAPSKDKPPAGTILRI